MQLVDNCIFAMTIINGDDALIVDGNGGLDDDNEVLGAMSEAGMLMAREDDAGDMPAKNPIKLERWDPFQHGGVIAPEGFTYIGMLSSFI